MSSTQHDGADHLFTLQAQGGKWQKGQREGHSYNLNSAWWNSNSNLFLMFASTFQQMEQQCIHDLTMKIVGTLCIPTPDISFTV